MTSKRFCGMILAVAALTTAARADQLDEKIRIEFFAGFKGNTESMDRAMKAAELLMAANPNGSAEAMAWHGGALMMRAGLKFEAGDAAAGADLWARGLAEMNKAGMLEPDNPAILVPRASIWMVATRTAPPAVGAQLLGRAVSDYERVFEMRKPVFDGEGIHKKSELLFGLADGYMRMGNQEKARFYFEKTAALGPAGGHFDQATKYLKGEKYTIQGVGCVGCHSGNN
jgi:tetratricopeptide (TPR) repeat protein